MLEESRMEEAKLEASRLEEAAATEPQQLGPSHPSQDALMQVEQAVGPVPLRGPTVLERVDLGGGRYRETIDTSGSGMWVSGEWYAYLLRHT